MRLNRHRLNRSRPIRRLQAEVLEPRLALAADITTGLVHYWTFDETSGDVAHDSAGNADGTLVNWSASEPKWEPGRVAGALQFSSADNYVITPFDSTPVPGSFALSFWLNVSDREGPNARIIAPKGGNVVFINHESNRGVSFLSNAAVDFSNAAFDPSAVQFNGWDHYALNFNATTKQGIIYRNGAPVAIATYNDFPHLGSWVIGHHEDLSNNDQTLHGALDDFRMYNRVLTDEDIAALASMGQPTPTHVGPIHHWTFNETTGFTAHDVAGGADGTLLNWNQAEPRWATGKVGGALQFSTSDNAVVTAPAGVQAQWSIAYWVQVNARTGAFPRILGPDDGRELWSYIAIETNGGSGFQSHSIDTIDPTSIPLNTWVHFVITFDTNVDVGTIYRNGQKVKSGPFHDNSPIQAWVIGHNRDLGNHNDSLNGLIDDLRVYDRVLGASEIQRLAALTPVEVKADSYTVAEDTLLTVVAAQGVLSNDTDLDDSSPQAFLDVGPQHGTVNLKTDGSFTYQPAANYRGPDQFTYRLKDRIGNDVTGTVSLTVTELNHAPSFTKGPNIEASDELAGLTQTTTIGFDDLTGAPDNLFYHYTEGDFSVVPISGRWIEAHDPSHITGHPAPAIYGDTYNATLEIKRTSGGTFALAGFDLASWEFDFFATNSPVQYTVEGSLNGQVLYSSTGQVVTSDFHAITGLPCNWIDTLRFHMVRVDSQAYILDNIQLVTQTPTPPSAWATDISAGAPDEASQKLNFIVTADKPELFEVQPAVDPSGKLTFVPKANVSGTATVSVALHDDGGTANGGSDTSPTQTFTINIVKEHRWHNVGNSHDVDGDGNATGSDALAVINYINSGLSTHVLDNNPVGKPFGFLDVDPDNVISGGDALAVINAINAAPARPAASFLGVDTTTQGNWIGKYGGEGYSLNSGPTRLPQSVNMSFKSGLTEIYDYVVEDANNDPQALQLPGSDDRLLATWTGDYGFILDLKFQDQGTHRVALYVPGPRYQRMDVIDANTGSLLDSRVAESMDGGQYLVWNVAGHVKIRFSNLANGLNAVLGAIFFG